MNKKNASSKLTKKKSLKEHMNFDTAKEILTYSGYKFQPEDNGLLYKFLDNVYKYGLKDEMGEVTLLNDLTDDELRSEFENFKYETEDNEDAFYDSNDDLDGDNVINDNFDDEIGQLDEMITSEKNLKFPGRHSIKEEDDEFINDDDLSILEDSDESSLNECDVDYYDQGFSHENGDDELHESIKNKNKFINEDRFLLQDVDDVEDDMLDENEDEEEDIDIETPYDSEEIEKKHVDDDIDSDDEVREGPNTYEKVNDDVKSLFSLDDLKGLVKSIMGELNDNPENLGNATTSISDETIPTIDTLSDDAGEISDDTEGDFPNILDTEFDENGKNISQLETDENTESYLNTINGNPEHAGVEGNVAVGQNTLMSGSDEVDDILYDNELGEDVIDEDLEIIEPIDPIYEDSDEELDETESNEIKTDEFSLPDNKKIKIMISGWLITEGEVKYLNKIIKENKGRLRALKSSNKDLLYLLVEANKKFYTIKYNDKSNYETVTPWTCKDRKYLSLKEAVRDLKNVDDRSKKKVISKEKQFFNKLVEKDGLYKREMNNIKKADIFEDFRNETNYVPSWNVKSAGSLNLKNGLNEVFSKVTQHTPDVKNTLFQTKEGQYFLIKGNIAENSKLGTKRHLIDFDGKRDYGVGKVMGLYENSMKGLGKIMEKINRTSITLLTLR